MSQPQAPRSSIIYQNVSRSVILIDIPTSIGLAQRLPHRIKTGETPLDEDVPALLSSDPLQDPYPNPPEPSSTVARNRLLRQIPDTQLELARLVEPLIDNALQELKEKHGGEWCFPRYSGLSSGTGTKRRMRMHEGFRHRASKRHQESSDDEPIFSSKNELLDGHVSGNEPPLVLAPGVNQFPNLSTIRNTAVQNAACTSTILNIKLDSEGEPSNPRTGPLPTPNYISINIPAKSTFLLTHLRAPTPSNPNPILSLSSGNKFDLIVMDPPWPNRSVRRSSHYREETDSLQPLLEGILKSNINPRHSIVAMWTTNSSKSRSMASNAMKAAGLHLFEEWIWVKSTAKGQPVSPVAGLWRKPYEILILAHTEKHTSPEDETSKGNGSCEIRRRVIFAVPDIHSRKPNLREVIEDLFFSAPTGQSEENDAAEGDREHERQIRPYAALEVFARNLTAGWWSCGDEVLRFNWKGWWDESGRERGEEKGTGC
ncbi:hypothetical protein FQN55_006203 [Onygenales sp. PD_40]|nr:hypothetical protein FQN55_006203 [Onygenales sp. PD_40]